MAVPEIGRENDEGEEYLKGDQWLSRQAFPQQPLDPGHHLPPLPFRSMASRRLLGYQGPSEKGKRGIPYPNLWHTKFRLFLAQWPIDQLEDFP